MNLNIDGHAIEARPGMTLLELVRELGLDSPLLSRRPIAAKIAGEVFTLNYIPLREKDAAPERSSIRRAMAASEGKVHLLRFSDPTGKDAYTRTAQFVLFLAIRQLWPQAQAKMNCTVGTGLYINVKNAPDFSAEALKERVTALVRQDIPLMRRRVSTKDAMAYFAANGQDDKTRLLQWRSQDWFDEYAYGDFADYNYGEMAPSTGYLQVWDILPAKDGFMFIFPDDQDPDRVAHYEESPNFFEVINEGERWGQLMECETVADQNDQVNSGRIRELIRVIEALNE